MNCKHLVFLVTGLLAGFSLHAQEMPTAHEIQIMTEIAHKLPIAHEIPIINASETRTFSILAKNSLMMCAPLVLKPLETLYVALTAAMIPFDIVIQMDPIKGATTNNVPITITKNISKIVINDFFATKFDADDKPSETTMHTYQFIVLSKEEEEEFGKMLAAAKKI